MEETEERMGKNTRITVARGDGIGPEIMDATLAILNSAKARIEIEEIEIGEKIYLAGNTTGIGEDAWKSLAETKVFLKAPITTPQGGGVKSLNVTARKTLGLYANVRPCVAYHPFIRTNHPTMDVVVVRENEEDLYAGIEHQQTPEVAQCLRLISRTGSKKIARFAFEYARSNGRKKVTCFTKDNIMKITDGMFHRVFDEVAQEYPDIENEHWIVDIGCAKLASTPENFDVIVMPNLYGDILSDMAAQLAGSVGLAPGANIGSNYAMFEAIHGSAPRRAGKNMANPSGLLLSSVMMLVYIDQPDVAKLVHNAWLKTLEDGIHTYDVFHDGVSTRKVGTKEFAQAIIERLGDIPLKLKPVDYRNWEHGYQDSSSAPIPTTVQKIVGVDVFVQNGSASADELARIIATANTDKLQLKLISNRGTKVWPDGNPETFCSDHWRCRFYGSDITHTDITQLLQRMAERGHNFIKTEHLMTMNGEPSYSLGQGE